MWAAFGERSFQLGLMLDPLSATMCLVVTAIGWLIMLYSVGYMGEDPRFSRFFAFLSLFCAAMLLLVLSDHLLLLYIGWEVVGLCSYLLISFWFERPAAALAGKKAFLTTRLGDVGLLGGILLIGHLTGSLSLIEMKGQAAALGPWVGVAALLIFWGAAGKSAQFPLHVWLPDAMEGPTPVSALIHAATMVAAGVYLVARTLPLFTASPDAMLVVASIAAATSFFAATIACTQTDLKRILAYSTISQLGLMMLGLGCGSAFAGMFHLVTHACFKALLFLAAGSVIHALHHQEITRMGGLWKPMPVTGFAFTAGAVAMAGIPPFSGFWSKEEILTAVSKEGSFFLIPALMISFLTAFYITRAVLLTFFGAPKEKPHHPIHESGLVMTIPLLVLSAGALFVGLIGSPQGNHLFQHFLGAGIPHREGGHGPSPILVASIAVALGGTLLSFLRYAGKGLLLPESMRQPFRPLHRLIANKYYIDEIYEAALIRPLSRLCALASRFDARVIDGAVNQAGEAGLAASRAKRWIDEKIVDGLVNLTGWTVGRTGALLRTLQTGLVQNYLLIAAAGALTMILMLR